MSIRSLYDELAALTVDIDNALCEGGTHGLYNSCQVQGTLENMYHDTLRDTNQLA